MNQEFKNLDMLMETLKLNLKNQDFGASKTIVNIYNEMLPNTIVILNTTLKGWYCYSERGVLNRHLEDFKELNKETINKVIPKLIASGEFKSLHNLQYIQQKMQGFITTLESVPESEPQHVYTDEQSSGKTRALLDLSVKTGGLITQVKEDLRGTGKTTELIKKANELDVTLIVGTHSVKDFIDKQAREMGYKIDCRYINNLGNIRGLRLKNSKFLVDDSTTNQIIKELINSGNEFVGGFNSLSNSLSVQDKTLEFLRSKLSKLTEDRHVAVRACSSLVDRDSLTLVGNLNMKINFLEELLEEMKNNTK